MKTIYTTIILIAFICKFSNAQTFSIGDNVQANGTNVNVRSTAAGTSVGYHNTGDIGKIVSGPTTAILSGTSYVWYQVQWQTSPTSGWSVNTYLTKVTTTLGTPTLSSPADGASFSVGNTISFSWSTVTNADGYDIIFDSGLSTQYQYHSSTNSYSNLQSAVNAGSHTWKVRATNGTTTGSWSSSRSYTVAITLVPYLPNWCIFWHNIQ